MRKANPQFGSNKQSNKSQANKQKGRKHVREKHKRTLKDYFYYSGSTQQASAYESTTDFVINHIKGNFAEGQDIAESLKNLRYCDTNKCFPKLEYNKNTN